MAGERYKLIVKNGRVAMKTLGGFFNYLLGIKDVAGAGTVLNGIVDWTIQNRTKTTAEWTADTTTILLRGQLGIEDTGDGNFKAKIGNGTGLWSALGYITGSGGSSSFANLTGDPYDNTALSDALNDKADQTDLAQEIQDRQNADSILASAITSTQNDIDTHEANTSNPHGVTAAQVGTYTTTQIDNKDSATLSSANTYTDNAVSSAAVGKLSDQGNYDASGNTYPVAANTNPVVAQVKKGFLWTISVGGTLGGVAVTTGDVVRALVDNPGQTSSNWVVTENNIGYVPENNANKSNSLADIASTSKFPVWAILVSYVTGLGYLLASVAASTYVSLSGSYSDPSWITSLSWSKITGARFKRIINSKYLDSSPITGITPGTPTYLDSILIPGGSYTGGDFWWMYSFDNKTGNNAATSQRLYINTSATLSGATLLAQATTNATTDSATIGRMAIVRSNSQILISDPLTAQQNADGLNSGLVTLVSINLLIDQYLIAAEAPSSASDTVKNHAIISYKD